jgi:hyaluronoglucosaminidase
MLMNRACITGLIVAASAGAACAQWGPAFVGDTGDSAEARPVYWCVTNNKFPHKNWAAEIDFAGADIRRDVVIFYAWRLGRFPYVGPHRHAMDPTWMDSHLAKLRTDVVEQIPDPNYSGLAIIDYEKWSLNWERTRNKPGQADPFALDYDFQDDWREYIREYRAELLRGLTEEQKEEVFEQTYEECAKEIYLATLNECKSLRPHTKWSFFAYPVVRYRYPRELPPDVIGYDDHSHEASRLNDELQWLWEAEDFICSTIYAPRITIPEGQRRSSDGFEDWPSQFRRFAQSNPTEAVRVAGDKPVFPCISLYYTIPDRDFPWLNDLNLELSFQALLKDTEADGAIIWGDIASEQYAQNLQAYVRDHLSPVLLQVEPGLAVDGDSERGGSSSERVADSGSSKGGVQGTGRSAKKGTAKGGTNGTASTPSAKRARFPFRFQGKTDRVSKPAVTRNEALEARHRAAQQKQKAMPRSR